MNRCFCLGLTLSILIIEIYGTSAPTNTPTQTSNPSPAPTLSPTLSPTEFPTPEPTAFPTHVPSVTPSLPPTRNPTRSPTYVPTTEPTFMPTCNPTRKPTRSPTCVPTFLPTSPSGTPSAVPSFVPSFAPSAPPSFAPSSPTIIPTLQAMPRSMQCGECQKIEDGICEFFSETVNLECSSDSHCTYEVDTFAVLSGTNIIVDPSCGFVVYANRSIHIDLGTTITADFISMFAVNGIKAQGTLITSGRGPIEGAGSGGGSGLGGTYGGSGGDPSCTPGDIYSNYDYQIGSANVTIDLIATNYTGGGGVVSGSGGGVSDSGDTGGTGGGMVVLRGGVVNITQGHIMTDGATSPNPGLGSGSGGSISILCNNLVAVGAELSAVGGDGSKAYEIAAGGGGRIYLQYKTFDFTGAVFSYQGGAVDDDSCLSGAGGTAVYSTVLTTVPNNYNTAILIVDNNNQVADAATVIEDPSLAAQLKGVGLQNRATVAVKKLKLTQQCPSRSQCHSYITSINSVVVSLYRLSGDSIGSTGIELSADSVSVLHQSRLDVPFYLYIDSKEFIVNVDSVASYGCVATVYASSRVTLDGEMDQIYPPSYCSAYSKLGSLVGLIIQTYNVSITSARAQNIFIGSTFIYIHGPFLGVPSIYNLSSCFDTMSTEYLSCSNFYSNTTGTQFLTGALNSVTLASVHSIVVGSDVSIAATVIFFCSPHIYIRENATLSTDARGCPANNGLGAGTPPQSSQSGGGGGGGFGGGGGAGSSSSPGGVTYSTGVDSFSVGSGGGALMEAPSNFSAGGGLIMVNSSNSIVLDGVLSANGGAASSNGGGGSGGMVALFAVSLTGSGVVEALGGLGGESGGGGGGGGVVVMDNLGDSNSYTFGGVMNLTGGGIASAQVAQFYTSPTYPEVGESGIIEWPICAPGIGNTYATYSICFECEVGLYKEGYNGEECKTCKNKPTHSDYTTNGMTSHKCDYECDSSYVGSDCITPLQKFMRRIGGENAFIAIVISSCFLLFVPLLIVRTQRNIRKYNQKNQLEKKNHIFGSIFSSDGSSSTWMNPVLGENLLFEKSVDSAVSPSPRNNRTKSLQAPIDTRVRLQSGREVLSFQELRVQNRMADKDLPHHAARIYLWGSNSPFLYEGGPWHWPLEIPYPLRPMLRKPEYDAFVTHVNSVLYWDAFGWDAWIFSLLSLCFPPYADEYMLWCRLKKSKLLMDLIATCNYSFFKSNRQRELLNSLRVGISPDLTVAYVDILCDEGTQSLLRPQSRLGQPRFPIVLRICGHGTYFSPWYIDTNDVLVQAISQSSEISVFIDKAWMIFVIELNSLLKTIRRHRLRSDLPKLLKFLTDERRVGTLGGLIIHFCSFIHRSAERTSSSMTAANSPTDAIDPELGSSRSQLTEFAQVASSHPEKLSKNDSGGLMGFMWNQNVRPSDDVQPVEATDKSRRPRSGILSWQYPKSNDQVADDTRSTFGRNSAMLRRNYFADMFQKEPTEGDERDRGVEEKYYKGNESELSFGDLCDGLFNGSRFPGIVIFHESTSIEDVLSDNLSTKCELHLSPEASKEPHNAHDTGVKAGYEDTTGNSTDIVRERSDSVGLTTNARDAYGDRADELAKFYKIVRKADKTRDNNKDSDTPGENKDTTGMAISMDSENLKPRSVSFSPTTNRGDSSSVEMSNPIESDGGPIESKEFSHSISDGDKSPDQSGTPFRPFSPYSLEIAANSEAAESRISSGHLFPVSVWKWDECTAKPTKVVAGDITQLPTVDSGNFSLLSTCCDVRFPFRDSGSSMYLANGAKKIHQLHNIEIFLGIFIVLGRLLCHGTNRSPLSKIVRQLAGVAILSTIVADIGCTCVVCMNMWCIWGDSTECDDHSGVILPMVIWPAALVMSPLIGLISIILTPTGRVARQYACWSRLARFSIITLFVVYASWSNHAPLYTLWFLMAMVASRLIQMALVDFFIATHEYRRTTRGWDGLFLNIMNGEYSFK